MKRDKEWLITELIGNEVGDYDDYYNGDYEDGLAYALKLAHQLDEPEKVVIPRFVADWIEHCKANDLDLYEAFGHSDMSVEVSDLVGDMDADILARAWLDGYEVEKEKFYYVLDKQGKTLLVLMGGEVRISGGYVLSESTATKDIYQLTEKQIKDYDERFWQFAVEVAE